MPTQHADVLILGGGIIGSACAHELARRGVKVTLIDKGEIGHGCSYGNAGWITPCFALPLPMPGMLLKSIGWLLDPASPLYIQPRPSTLLAAWLWRFMRSMTHEKMLRAVAALTTLSKTSLDAYRSLEQQSPGAFGFTARGLLVVAQSEKGMKAAMEEMELVAARGIPGQLLDERQVREREPVIRPKSVIGGVYFPEEAHVEPLATVRHFIALSQQHGVRIEPHTEVLDIDCRRKSAVSVFTTRGEFTADGLVIAAGAWSGRLAARIGVRLPMLSGKGYAMILPPPPQMPRQPIMILDRKVAITPRADSLRIAGTLELVDLDESVTQPRVESILRGAASVLDLPAEPEVREVWRGLRPCTPDGLPAIGPTTSRGNVYLATGHQMLGLQTAPATGRLLAELMTGEAPFMDPDPFRPDRFNW